MQSASLPTHSRIMELRDGSLVVIRPLCYEDKAEFLNMFNRLTSETKLLRYHYVKLKMTMEEAERYCSIDYYDKFVLVAEKKYNCDSRIVGLGRYDRIGSTKIAEISFLVDDHEQGKGICTNLLVDLVKIAKSKGISTCVGILTNANTVMLDIIKKFKPDLRQELDSSDIIVTFDI
jgi:acetyltransferase